MRARDCMQWSILLLQCFIVLGKTSRTFQFGMNFVVPSILHNHTLDGDAALTIHIIWAKKELSLRIACDNLIGKTRFFAQICKTSLILNDLSFIGTFLALSFIIYKSFLFFGKSNEGRRFVILFWLLICSTESLILCVESTNPTKIEDQLEQKISIPLLPTLSRQ